MEFRPDIDDEMSNTATEGDQPVQKMSSDGGAIQEDENRAEDDLFANTTKRRNLSEEVNSTVGKVEQSTNAPVAEAAQESTGDARNVHNLAEVLDAENNRDEDTDVTDDTPGVGVLRGRRITFPVIKKDAVAPKKRGRPPGQTSAYGKVRNLAENNTDEDTDVTDDTGVGGLHGRRRTLPAIKKDAVAPKKRGRPPGQTKKRGRPLGQTKKRGRPPGQTKKRGTPPGQRNSTYGTEFPCIQCSNSYQRYETLRNHVYGVHDGKNLVPKKNYSSNTGSLNCSYCTASFDTREACFKHTMEYHQEDLEDENDLQNARKEEPTSTQRLNVRHVRRYGIARGPTGRILVQIKKDDPPKVQDKDSLDELVKCLKCDKQFKDNQFLKMHMLISHPAPSEDKRRFCDECGEAIRSIDFANHRNTCLSANTRSSEAQGSSKNANDSMNRSPFTPPVAKKIRDDISHEKNDQRSTAKPKGPRANTQMVIRNLSNSFDKRQSPMTGSTAVAHGTNDSVILPQYTSTPRRIITSATSVDEDRIEKSSHPLLLGIYVCSQKYPDEHMVVWSVSLEEDLVHAVSEMPDKAILCVQKINMEDMFNLNTKQKELLNKSQKITFNVLDENELCKQWTVISFGNIPSGLEGKLFTRFADVEKIFEDHVRKNGKTVNNIMRCDGLFHLLSQHLQKKITAFNQ